MWQAVLDMMNRKDHLKEEGIEVNLKIRELQRQSLGPLGTRPKGPANRGLYSPFCFKCNDAPQTGLVRTFTGQRYSPNSYF